MNAWKILSPRWAWLSLFVASALPCAFSFARQGFLGNGAWYAVLLAVIATWLGLFAWLFASILVVGPKTLWGILRRGEPAPNRARAVTAAGLALCAWLGGGFADKYASFPAMAMEGLTRGRLSELRSALSIHIGDHDGAYPKNLSELIPKSIDVIPEAGTIPHGKSAAVRTLTGEDLAAGRFSDSGGWAYVVSGPSSGTVFVDCTHTDLRGALWTSY